MGASQRSKGLRAEREIVALHRELGIRCERVPLSGAAGYQNNSNDVDIYLERLQTGPLVAEVKARKGGEGFTMLERWLSTADLLFLRRDRKPPMVLLPWDTYERLLLKLK